MPNWSEYTLNWMAYYGQTSFSQTHTPNPLIDKYILDTTKPNDLYPYSSNNTKLPLVKIQQPILRIGTLVTGIIQDV